MFVDPQREFSLHRLRVEAFAFGEGRGDQGTRDTVATQVIKADILVSVAQFAAQTRGFVYVAGEITGDVQDRDNAGVPSRGTVTMPEAQGARKGDHCPW